MAYQAKYWNGSAWVAVANASFDTSGLVKTTGNTGTVDLSGAPVVKGAGMDLIVPTSVTGGTYSASGAISFSAVSELNINGCFTSAYANYYWVVNFSAVSGTDAEITVRMRAAGANEAGANYASQRLSQRSTTVAGFENVVANTSMNLFHASTANSANSADGMFLDPQNAAYTKARTSNWYWGSDSNLYQQLNMALLKNTTAYDGFSIIPQSGNVSGTLRIYGLHN